MKGDTSIISHLPRASILMKKEIREIDQENNIWRVTTTDERVYLFPSQDEVTGLPNYIFKPSSTYILAKGYPKGYYFQEWLKKMGSEAEQIKVLAGEKGSKIHQGVEQLVNKKKIEYNSKFINPTSGLEEEVTQEEYEALMSFNRFWEELKDKHEIKIYGLEFTIDSDKYNYAGTADLLILVDDKEYWLIDLKSGQNIYQDHVLQLSSYKHAILEKKVLPYKDKLALRTFTLQVGYGRNNKRYKLTETEDKFDVFLSAKQIFHNEVAKLPYTQVEYPTSIQLNFKKDGKKRVSDMRDKIK